MHALPDDATVAVLGWPDELGEVLPRRGDLTVLVVDTLSEGSGFASRLLHADVEAVDVPLAGLGAAVAASSLVLLESPAIGPDEFLAVAGSRAAAAVARHAGIPVWLVGGVGRLLPQRMWDGLRLRVEGIDDPWDAHDEVVPLDLVDRIAGPAGPRARGRRPAPHRLPDRPRAVPRRRHLTVTGRPRPRRRSASADGRSRTMGAG